MSDMGDLLPSPFNSSYLLFNAGAATPSLPHQILNASAYTPANCQELKQTVCILQSLVTFKARSGIKDQLL